MVPLAHILTVIMKSFSDFWDTTKKFKCRLSKRSLEFKAEFQVIEVSLFIFFLFFKYKFYFVCGEGSRGVITCMYGTQSPEDRSDALELKSQTVVFIMWVLIIKHKSSVFAFLSYISSIVKILIKYLSITYSLNLRMNVLLNKNDRHLSNILASCFSWTPPRVKYIISKMDCVLSIYKARIDLS